MIPLASTKGPATLTYNFAVEYQLGAFGLPSLPTFFPALLVSGTVQMSSFASVSGSILYDGVVAPATPGSPPTTIDTVNYSYFNGTPGMFTANAVTATPVNGTTPALQPGTTLTLSGSMIFTVDPSELFASSTMVPEPSTALLALLSAPLLLRRRRA